MHPASDRENNDSKNSESSPALKRPSEFNVIRTARSVGTGNEMTTLKGNDLPLKPGPEDIPGDDNNGDDETVLHNDHCDDCDTTLDDKESMNHHLKRHQQLVTQTTGDLVEDRLNGSVPSEEPIAEIRFAYDAFKCIYLEDDTRLDEHSELIKTEYEVSLFSNR